MAEALAVVGLVAAIVQFVDFGSKIVSRLNEFQSMAEKVPASLRDVKTQLPLLLNTLQRTKTKAEAGVIDRDTQLAIVEVVEGCRSQVQLLDNILLKTLPTKDDSRWRRGVKAFISVAQEKEVHHITERLRNYVQTLTYHEATGSSKAQPIKKKHLFTVPFERDPKFVGRSDILDQIDQKIQNHRRVALAGIGGVGKSQIAIEYCYRFKDKYPTGSVLWVHASTISRFEQAYSEIARKACLPGWEDPKVDKPKLVFEWLSDELGDPWLLVLDNADDEEVFWAKHATGSVQGGREKRPLVDYVPRSSNGNVIITTRDRRVGERLADREKPIAVLPLPTSEAGQLLRSLVSEENEWSDTDSEELVQALDYLPLAISQAAAFISENNITLAEYCEMLQSNDSELKDLLLEELEDPRRDSTTQNSVIRTWKISFDQISQQKPRAAEMLSLMAVLSRQGIPKSLLRRKEERLTEYTTAVGVLQAFCLITAEKGGTSFGMHRLVQVATQRWLELKGTMSQWQEEALKLMAQAFPRVPKFEDWPSCESFYPHVQVLLGYSSSSQTCQLHRASVLNDVSTFDSDHGRNSLASSRCKEALAIRERILGLDHNDTLKTLHGLGIVLMDQGQYKEAEAIYRKTLEAFERVLGLEHQHTLATISNLSGCLSNQGEYEAAEAIAQRVLDLQEKTLGPEHLNTINTAQRLGVGKMHQGKFEAAEGILRQTLERLEKVLGPEHPYTILCLDNLASALSCQSKYEVAEPMTRRALELREKLLGLEHPDTLESLNSLAVTLYLQGKCDVAELVARRALKGREEVLGPKHPNTLVTLHNLALVLACQGNYNDAEAMARRALEGYDKVLGPKHRDTLETLCRLARILYHQEKDDAAEAIFRQALERQEEVLGPNHPDTLMTLRNLALVLYYQRNDNAAEVIARRALEGQQQVLEKNHPDTLRSVKVLIRVLRAQGKTDEAKELRAQYLDGTEEESSSKHSDSESSEDELDPEHPESSGNRQSIEEDSSSEQTVSETNEDEVVAQHPENSMDLQSSEELVHTPALGR